jgi:hypothetical protein
MNQKLLIASLLSLAVLAVYYSSSESKVAAFDSWKQQYGVSWAIE